MTPAAARARPRISCLMPIYNGEAFLAEALDSILAQTFDDFEIVCVDDGSVDRTPDILRRYAEQDARVRIIRQPNGGIVSALNAGLAECRGDHIARMDADDVSLPHRFAVQSAYLDANPSCVLVGGLAVSERAEGEAAPRTSGGWRLATDMTVFPPQVAVSIHPLIMVRRDALMRLGGYRSDFPHAEDYDLFIRLAEHGTIDNPDEVVLFYRRHDGALSVRNVEQQERSAALAEVAERSRMGLKPIPDWLLGAYIRLRIWRRYRSVDRGQARKMLPVVLGDLFDVRPRTLLSRPHWGVRLRIAVALGRLFRSRTGSSRPGAVQS